MIEGIKHGLNGYKRYKCRCGVCLEAHRQSRIRERLKSRRTLIKHSKIDATPLIELYKETVRSSGSIIRLLNKWESGGITVYEADEYCMKIGMHPIEVFGASYFEGLAEEEQEYRQMFGELADV